MYKSDPRTSNIATGLWERYAIWHSRSTPSPSGNGSALSGTRCYANSPGRSAVNDKAIYEGQPGYLASLLNQHTPKRCLRSSSGLLLDVLRVNLERFGRRAFACAGPTLWNNLPISLRVNGNHTQFKLLMTYLFSS